jgi:hypothetical protein
MRIRQGGLAESLYFEQPRSNDGRRLGDKRDDPHDLPHPTDLTSPKVRVPGNIT